MDLQDFKLYGLCIMRLRHQIQRALDSGRMRDGRVELESFCTAETDEIVDLLELYDLEDRTRAGLMEMLGELAADASLFVSGQIEFAFNEESELSLYLLAEEAEARSWEMQPAEREEPAAAVN